MRNLSFFFNYFTIRLCKDSEFSYCFIEEKEMDSIV